MNEKERGSRHDFARGTLPLGNGLNVNGSTKDNHMLLKYPSFRSISETPQPLSNPTSQN